MADPATLTAAALLEAYRAKALSPVEVVESLLARIDRLDPHLNAFYLVDHDGALAAARASEARWRRGEPCGAFDGVPTSIKDAIDAKGWPVYRGSAAHSDTTGPSRADAPLVARLREHGAIFLGKTTMPDFGILASGYSSQHGVTRNPRDPSRTTGGSSSGAAASIAAGFNPVAAGTDIVGSIRLPAAFCGLVGLKPSQGRVPYYFPNSPALVAGPMARTVLDAALLLDIIARPDAADFTALPPPEQSFRACLEVPVTGARIGLITRIGFGLEPDAEVLELVTAAARRLQDAGCRIEALDPPFSDGADEPAEDFYRTRCYTEFMNFPAEKRARADVIERWTAPAGALSARDLFEAINRMTRLREATVRLMDGFDFLILPSVPVAAFAAELPAPDSDRPFSPWCNNFLFNLTEQPASSVPCGTTAQGLPVGLQIVGRRFDDAGVLRLSNLAEQLFGQLPVATLPDDAIVDSAVHAMGDHR